MNVIAYNFGISIYSDGTSVLSPLSAHFNFSHIICLEHTRNLEMVKNTWKGCKLTLVDYMEETAKLKFGALHARDMPPLSRELIEKLSFDRCILNSMNRDETLLYRHLDQENLHFFEYWNYLLDKFEIDLVLFHGIPHATFSYALYALCKARGIKIIYIARSCVPGYFICHDDVYKKFEKLEREYNAAMQEDSVELSEFMRTYYLDKMENGTFKTPTSFKMSSRIAARPEPERTFSESVLWLLKGIFRVDRWGYNIGLRRDAAKRRRIQESTEKHYRKLSIPADYSAKFIYVPLHMQPEMTTSPNGNVYVNLYLMVKTIAHSVMDTDILVYVKEHGDQKKGYRPSRRELYDSIRTIPNVRLIDIEESTFKLQDHCIATATCSGTIIMETLFRYKPILVFGNYINSLSPNALIVTGVDSCRRAIDSIISGEFSVGKKERDAFLKAVERSGYRGFVRTEYAADYLLTQDESADNIVAALKEAIGEWLVAN